MNKQLIARTAVCYLSTEYEEYIVESPLLEGCAGIGDTEEEAHRVFGNLLDDAYETYLEGRMADYDKPGRPSKGRVALNTDVKPAMRNGIKKLAQEFGCSQGEIIDYLYFFHWATEETRKATQGLNETEERLITTTVTLTALQVRQLLKEVDPNRLKKQNVKPTRRKARTA